ncbi:LysR family transcriptional regulator [Siculibacillus lacustris]|uniref:LysR family transcriptional regulator n=1 Tax=Siculibacillus lacustris TaxID=1549641 RepID=A0A4Q9VUT6_9HYPH|nr:LysR family transcriptional regulator [Siculibacillus lacustris]TBW39985.1 LysR family transcriptional regulator [Siculibacillus lacustris]
MDLKQLEQFVVVAEERHFTRAARRLNMVQSGLSAAIRGLEEELGGPLFLRSTRRVDLTPAGEVLLGEARRVLETVRNARQAVTDVHGLSRGRLRIAAIQNPAPFVDLARSLGRFRAAHEGIEIDLAFDGSTPLFEEVRDGRFDVAFTQPREPLPPGVTMRMIACEGLVVACAPDHRLAGAEDIALAELAQEIFVELKPDWGLRRLVDRAFAAAGLTRRIGFEVNDPAIVLDLAAQGLGIALVPESIAAVRQGDGGQPPIAVAAIRPDQEPCWELAVAFRGTDGEAENRVAAAFLAHLVVAAPPAG